MDSPLVLANGNEIKDAKTKSVITAAIVAGIESAKSRRRLEGEEL